MSIVKHPVSRPRLLFVDGLRGIAAMSVVVCHFYGHLRSALDQWLHEFVQVLMSHGFEGVTIFFVLSGLVITKNVGVGNVRGSFLLRFALRRSIRLDPPYWLAIATALGMMFLAESLFTDIKKTYPSAAQIASHFVYLQDILGYGDIVAIFWTLCFEIQFYLFIVLILLLAQLLTGSDSSVGALRSPIFQFFWLLLIAISVLDFIDYVPWEIRGLFLPSWFSFALGATTIWTMQGRMPIAIWYAAFLVVACGLLAGVHALTIAVALATSAILLLAGRTDGMSRWLSGPLIQFLGRISYSLYLFHAIVGWSAISLFKRLWPGQLGVAGSAGAFVFGVGVSIATAWVVYRLVELPSIALSRRIPLRPD